MENVLFKIAYPAEFHAQTAVEARDRAPSAGQGPARRDREGRRSRRRSRRCASSTRRGRCTTPPTATTACSTWSRSALIFGELTARRLRGRRRSRPAHRPAARQDARASRDKQCSRTTSIRKALDRQRACRSSSSDGSRTEQAVVEYPLGHRRRREPKASPC